MSVPAANSSRWIEGNRMTFSGGNRYEANVFQVPNHYHHIEHRCKKWEINRASCSLRYVTRGKTFIRNLHGATNEKAMEAAIKADGVGVAKLGASAKAAWRSSEKEIDSFAESHSQAALVLIGKTKRSLFGSEPKVDVIVEIRVEDRVKTQAQKHFIESKEEKEPQVQKALPKIAFGKSDWETYMGDVGKAPPLPRDIGEILQSHCSFWLERKVHQTHLLVLIPKTVNGGPFTLDLLGELIRYSKGGGRRTKYRHYEEDVKNELGAKGVERSYWMLMTKDDVPGSRDKDYEKQCQMVAKHRKYQLPSALEAATAILMHYVKTGERLYTDNLWTYTRCREKVNKNQWPAAIGGLSSSGLSLGCDFHDFRGVAGLRRV